MNLFLLSAVCDARAPSKRECKSAHGRAWPALAAEKRDISTTSPDNVRNTDSEVVYHYAPARKVPFERAEIDHLPPPWPDLLPCPLPPASRSFAFSPAFSRFDFHNREAAHQSRILQNSRQREKRARERKEREKGEREERQREKRERRERAEKERRERRERERGERKSREKRERA